MIAITGSILLERSAKLNETSIINAIAVFRNTLIDTC